MATKITLAPDTPDPMTPGELADLFRVSVKTVVRWDRRGKFPKGCVTRTSGGHRRFSVAGVEHLLNRDGGQR